MNTPLFQQAAEFIWQNARLLERKRFAYHFQGGAREDVLTVLRAYQNADGGFGNALEPDIRCPESQPVPVQHALEFLDAVGFDSDMVQRACDYLLTITTSEGGVPWLLPVAHEYPRAPWWNTTDDPPASLNPTAALAGLLHKNGFDHPWLGRATAYCWAKIDALQSTEMHEMNAVLLFLQHAPDRQRAGQALARMFDLMVSAGLIANLDEAGYAHKALDWAPTPAHPLRSYLRDEDIQANLDARIAEQQADGGWTIPWPPLSPGCEMEWRGWVTLGTLLTLRANGRL